MKLSKKAINIEPKHIDYIRANTKKIVIIDTETTGISKKDQIIEITLRDYSGRILFSSLVKSLVKISPEAQKVHNITKEELEKKGLEWGQVLPKIEQILKGKILTAYNSSFDKRLIRQTNKAHRINPNRAIGGRSFCSMYLFSLANNIKKDEKLSRRSLTHALDFFQIPHQKNELHRTEADTLATLKVLQKILKS